MIRLCPISHSLSVFALAAFSGLAENAQSQIFNQSTVYVNGVNIYVRGEISNQGLLQNHGTVALTGDWNNEGTYDGNGVLELNGSNPQKVSHRGQSVHTLLVDGWGTKYIKGLTNINSELILKNGIVEVSPEDVLNLKATAVIAGGSPQSYVDGALTVEGTGYKFFPVGKNGTYAPVEFTNVQGQDPQFAVEVFEHAPIVSIEDVIVKSALYWRRTDKRGKFGSSPIAIDYDRDYFENPEAIVLVTGTDWDKDFLGIKEVDHSTETDKITTRIGVSSPLILLGEFSERWTESDFYFSTALSPNALHMENHKVKIFGGRLAPDEFRFQVFDRWGSTVYEINSLDAMSTNGWDGRTSAGYQLPTGTYPYRMTARDKTGKQFEKKGVITIIH